MKKFSKIMIFTILSSFALVGCGDLLDVNSDRQVFVDEYNMKMANDTLYSMFGVFSQLEKLSDSYVLLGELRGDLMDVTDNSGIYLKELNNFSPSSSNPYANNIKDYYSVINNCNYVIHNIDTSIVKGAKKVMLKNYVACKAIRAWTFMQIALNFGSVHYYDNPILSIKDAEAVQKSDSYTFEQLAPILIADLAPYKDVDEPGLGSLYSYNTTYSYFPVRMLLGDLYLWTGQYESAANEYRDLMYTNKYLISSNYRNTYSLSNGVFNGNVNFWNFPSMPSENITNIASTNQYSQFYSLDSLTAGRKIIPSDTAIGNWASQMYYYSNSLDTLGDTRALGLVFSNSRYVSKASKNYIYSYLQLNSGTDNIASTKQIAIYRVPQLYLHYAEAVNRLGKPNLAFVVLKYGLNNINIRKYVPASERSSSNYMNFPDERFDFIGKDPKNNPARVTNIGIRMRGCGNVDQDTTYYIIPKLNAIQDSVLYVENLIEKELSLESAFQGNRFQDLMRFAIRRDDNSFLADRIAAKHKENKEAIRTKLMTRANWYLAK